MNRPIDTDPPPYEIWVLFWLVTEDPDHSGWVMGQRSAFEEGKFWDGHSYRPMAWCSHWTHLPTRPDRPWKRRA